MVPFLNQTFDFLLSDLLEARDVNVRVVIDAFKSQCEQFSDCIEAIVLISPGRFRVTCKSSRKLEIIQNMDFTVRDFPGTFQSVSSAKWVNATRLSYGVPDEELQRVLSPYGRIRLMRSEKYSNVYTGVRNVLMELTQDIPTRLRIAGHQCIIRYRGQRQLCFLCGH